MQLTQKCFNAPFTMFKNVGGRDSLTLNFFDSTFIPDGRSVSLLPQRYVKTATSIFYLLAGLPGPGSGWMCVLLVCCLSSIALAHGSLAACRPNAASFLLKHQPHHTQLPSSCRNQGEQRPKNPQSSQQGYAKNPGLEKYSQQH
eukprot:1142087-Pelagomonas_calceolata.AAC.10